MYRKPGRGIDRPIANQLFPVLDSSAARIQNFEQISRTVVITPLPVRWTSGFKKLLTRWPGGYAGRELDWRKEKPDK